MTQLLRLDDFERLPLSWTGSIGDGLSAALDAVADAGPDSHRFLRYQWFSAALEAYGGPAQTIVVASEMGPGIALPLIATFAWLGLAMLPGSFWPFRSFPSATRDPAAWDALLATVARAFRAVRIGPIYADDPALRPLLSAARRAGWAALPRTVGESFLLDIAAQRAEGAWPRGSTLRKNRFHEKHLAEHGTLSWEFVERFDDAAFADLAAVEQASWIASRTDGSDAKFTAAGHGAFWRAAARDPVIADMLHAALLRVDGEPAAFSFDLDAGATKYAIANSYDPAFAKHSPGKLLYYRNLTDAIERGIDRVDWGLGDSGYKRTIGADRGPDVQDWLLLRPGLPAAAGGLIRNAWARSG
ncbi:MAG: GNAT family N-acetyltransferase [Pseudomonadota bacterium]